MAITFTKGLTPARVDSMFNLWLPVLSTAEINLGAMVIYDSGNHYISDEVDVDTDDATFIGVALGESKSGSTLEIPVATRGIFKATLTSATYVFGASLKYDTTPDDGTLVADAGANTICWFWTSLTGAASVASAITEGYVWIDVTALASYSTPADKLWTGVHA